MTLKEKIAALIAKAEGTDNEHEASMFMAKAEQLMEEHQIALHELGEGDPVNVTTGFRAKESLATWHRKLYGQVARYYNCAVVRNTINSRGDYELEVIGRESNRITVEMMWPFILDQVKQSAKTMRDETGDNLPRAQRSIGNALAIRLHKIVSERKVDAPKHEAIGNALVHVNEIRSFMDSYYKNGLTEGRKGRGISTTEAAKEHASKVSLHRQADGVTQRQIT